MADISIEVKGIKEVQKALYGYSQQLGDKVVLGALRQGINVIAKKAKSVVPVKTGRLKRAIVVRKSKINNGKLSTSLIGMYMTIRTGKGKKDPKDGFYGRFLEDGWNVRGKNATKTERGARFEGRKTRKTQRGKTDVPGRYFIKGSFIVVRNQAVAAFAAALRAGAEVVKRKVGLR